MPQIYLKFAPRVRDLATESLIKTLDVALTLAVMEVWKVPQHDITVSAEHLIYARSEADVQIEIRYTAGEYEYDWGEPFDPTREEQESIAVRMQGVAQEIMGESYAERELAKGEKTLVIPPQFSVSVWTKPSYKGFFLPPEPSNRGFLPTK